MQSTVIVRLRSNVKKGDGITVHDKDRNLVTLMKWGEVESTECTEDEARSYVANYGHLLETVTPEDLNKQVSEITAFLKKKFPKEFGKETLEVEKDETPPKVEDPAPTVPAASSDPVVPVDQTDPVNPTDPTVPAGTDPKKK